MIKQGDAMHIPEAADAINESAYGGSLNRGAHFSQLKATERNILKGQRDYTIGASTYTLGMSAVNSILRGQMALTMKGEPKPAPELFDEIMAPFRDLPDGTPVGVFPFKDYPKGNVWLGAVTSLEGSPKGEGHLVVHGVQHNTSYGADDITPSNGWGLDVDLRVNWAKVEKVTPRMKITTIACDPADEKPLIIYPNWSIFEDRVAVGGDAIAAMAENLFAEEPSRIAGVMASLGKISSQSAY